MATRTESDPRYKELNRLCSKRQGFLYASALRWLAKNMPEIHAAIEEEAYKRFPTTNRPKKRPADKYDYLEALKP